ncbi:MAG: hypothetical protein HZA78_05000 [Candidatus Schekmanbacteria bacterium]|nr:hypothetical protein [Candidatus Schekmanbacteria bacterium]
MAVIKGIFNGNTVKLLEPVKAKKGMIVDVIFKDKNEKDSAFETALKQEFERMDKGFPLGGGPYYHSRSELHDR